MLAKLEEHVDGEFRVQCGSPAWVTDCTLLLQRAGATSCGGQCQQSVKPQPIRKLSEAVYFIV